MEKTKLAICMKDEEYQQRFVKCVMKHYCEDFELHIVDKRCNTRADSKEFYVVLTDDEKEVDEVSSDQQLTFVLKENISEEDAKNHVFCTEKYQEVYKIMEVLQKAISEKQARVNKQMKSEHVYRIGIFSLTKENMQIPFATLLAEILGEKHSVVLVDLQPFSGLSVEVEKEGILGMEDLISIATTENYTSKRVEESIGYEPKWEYIYPIRNSSCFMEADAKTYQKILEILEREKGYTYEIINFGAMFTGIFDFMDSCQRIHILTDKVEGKHNRELCFEEELHRRGKEDCLQKTVWTEIPDQTIRTSSWRQIAKNWLWGSLGDLLREQYWMEYTNGTNL